MRALPLFIYMANHKRIDRGLDTGELIFVAIVRSAIRSDIKFIMNETAMDKLAATFGVDSDVCIAIRNRVAKMKKYAMF